MTENVTLMTEESAATFEKLKPLITKYATNDVAMELLETYFERPEATPPGTEGFDGLIGRMEKKGMLKQGLLDELGSKPEPAPSHGMDDAFLAKYVKDQSTVTTLKALLAKTKGAKPENDLVFKTMVQAMEKSGKLYAGLLERKEPIATCPTCGSHVSPSTIKREPNAT
jgi:hypothetical protein